MIKITKYKTIIVVSLLAVFITGIAQGGSKRRRGTAGAQELLIPVGSGGIALAGANVASISGIESIEWNMGGLCRMNTSGEAMFSHATWLGDIGVNYAAVASKFGRNTIGMSLRSVDFGKIDITTALAPDGTGGTYSPNYVTIGFLFSRTMTDRINFGTAVKMINESVMTVSATGFVIDAGVQYSIRETGLMIGASVRNLGLTMLFNGSDLEEFHAPSSTEPGAPAEPRRIVLQDVDMPTTFELGTTYGPIDLGVAQIKLATSFLNNDYSFDEYRFGAEAKLMDMFYLRGGYVAAFDPEPYGIDNVEDTDDDADDDQWEFGRSEEYIWGPSLGFGLDLTKLTGLGLSIDYAYRSAEFFEGVNWLTLKVSF